jgi:hypothetical protein
MAAIGKADLQISSLKGGKVPKPVNKFQQNVNLSAQSKPMVEV